MIDNESYGVINLNSKSEIDWFKSSPICMDEGRRGTTVSDQWSIKIDDKNSMYIAPNENSRCFKAQTEKAPSIMVILGRKNSRLTGKKLEEQALGGVPICHDWLGVNTQNKEKLWTKLQFHIQYIIFVLYYFTKPSSDEFKDVIKNVMKEVCGCSFWCAISNLVLLYICCMLLNCDCLTAATGEVSQCFWCQWDQGIK